MGLDVAMDDSFFVEMGDGLKERTNDRDDMLLGKPLDMKCIGELAASEVVLDEDDVLFVFVDLMKSREMIVVGAAMTSNFLD